MAYKNVVKHTFFSLESVATQEFLLTVEKCLHSKKRNKIDKKCKNMLL